jgi:hypothetical protein
VVEEFVMQWLQPSQAQPQWSICTYLLEEHATLFDLQQEPGGEGR